MSKTSRSSPPSRCRQPGNVRGKTLGTRESPIGDGQDASRGGVRRLASDVPRGTSPENALPHLFGRTGPAGSLRVHPPSPGAPRVAVSGEAARKPSGKCRATAFARRARGTFYLRAMLLVSAHEPNHRAAGRFFDDSRESSADDLLDLHPLLDTRAPTAALEQRLLDLGEAAPQAADDEVILVVWTAPGSAPCRRTSSAPRPDRLRSR
jgi:hypothetical protein